MYDYNYSLIFWNAFKGWFIAIIIVQIIFAFITATFANSKGYSFGWGFLLGFCVPLFGAIAIIGLLPEKKQEGNNNQNCGYSQKEHFIENNNLRKCPFCLENINKDAILCRFCGKNIQEHDKEENIKNEQAKIKREQELKEKFKTIKDLFNDEDIMKEAKDLGRIYGKGSYICHLKSKAKELGLGEIELNEDDIEL